MSKGKTFISDNLQHVTKLIDPRSGKVIREGTTPTATVGEFKANPQPQVNQTDDRIEKLEQGMDEIKELLKQNLKK